MDADTGERGENAGRERCIQKSSHGLAAVRALVEAEEDAYVPISIKLAANCAADALGVFEDVVIDELFVTERCVAIVCQGHGGARSMAWFSPTKWECIMRLIRQMATAGHQRYVRLLALLNRILGRCAAAKVFGMAGAGAANESCVLSALWMVLLSERAAFFEGDSLARVEAVLAKCEATLFCAYTKVITKRLAGSYVVNLADHLAEFEGEHGALLRRAAAVAAPLVRMPRAAVDAVFVWHVRDVATPQDGDVPLLGVFAGTICAEVLGSTGASGMAASEIGRRIIDVELRHIGIDLRPPSYFANDAQYYLHHANENLGGDPNIPRRGSHTFNHTLGLCAADGLKSVTYLGMPVGVLWPAPGHASFARLLAARRPPRGFVDMYDEGARRAFFDLYNDDATVHTGSQEPAKILAKREGEWRCL
jgi:hypothetical protein